MRRWGLVNACQHNGGDLTIAPLFRKRYSHPRPDVPVTLMHNSVGSGRLAGSHKENGRVGPFRVVGRLSGLVFVGNVRRREGLLSLLK